LVPLGGSFQNFRRTPPPLLYGVPPMARTPFYSGDRGEMKIFSLKGAASATSIKHKYNLHQAWLRNRGKSQLDANSQMAIKTS